MAISILDLAARIEHIRYLGTMTSTVYGITQSFDPIVHIGSTTRCRVPLCHLDGGSTEHQVIQQLGGRPRLVLGNDVQKTAGFLPLCAIK